MGKTVRFDDGPSIHHPPKPAVLGASVKDIREKWRILPCYLGMRGLARQHINSYNNFVLREIKEIMNAPSNKVIRTDLDKNFFVEFVDIRVGRPYIEENMVGVMLTPHMCRLRDLTYSAPIYVDVDYVRGTDVIRKQNVEIGRLPVMLRSCVCALNNESGISAELDKADNATIMSESSYLGECPYDPGGYFIIKGVEKVILMQEQLSKSRVIVEYDVKKNICATVTSATAESKSRTAVVQKNQRLYVRHNSFTDDVPLCIILKAMGVETDKEIAQLIGTSGTRGFIPVGGDYIQSLQDIYHEKIFNRLDAVLYVGRKVRPRLLAKGFFASAKERAPKTSQNFVDDAHDILARVLLSHIPMRNSGDFSNKIKTLCLMARRVLAVASGKESIDDKDHYGNKRLELAGQLISILFEDLYKKFLFQLKKQIEQSLDRYIESSQGGPREVQVPYPDLFRNLPCDIITRGMQAAVSTGNWNIRRFRIERSGVSQVLSRLSYISCLGMMTKTNSQFEKGRKISGPRALQPSQFGLICPCDTPEGESCGLVKNLSLASHVTSDGEIEQLVPILYWLGIESTDSISAGDVFDTDNNWTVFLNGILLGVCQNASSLIQNLVTMRRCGRVSPFVSAYENFRQRQVHISSDGGRLCRPLIVVENGKSLLTGDILDELTRGDVTFSSLFSRGILEWMDVNEENNSLIALSEADINHKTTHLEISPMSMLGVVAGLIPFPNHNQSPRNTYQCAMGKQSIGTIGYNQLHRCDTVLHLMVYPQRPLVTTKVIQLVNFDKLPAGENAIVAVMSYQGYEIEDAIVVNKASIQRGFMRCFTLRRITAEIEKESLAAVSEQHMQQKGDICVGVGRRVVGGQVLVSKYSQNSAGAAAAAAVTLDGNSAMRDFRYTPVKNQFHHPCYVDRVVCTETLGGSRLYKVILRQTRIPEIGDKFSSRHGQKGVIGLVANQMDLPFSEEGWVPDLVMNPHGFPSRMTVGKLLELVAAKAGVASGCFNDATPFESHSVEALEQVLISKGFHKSGKELLCSGITGEMLETFIFTGPIYYQRLKHMVQDKIHARARGPRQLLTRQPTEGRSRDGGLRLGEMERDCLVAYGASGLLVERLMLSSDVFQLDVCHQCGFIGYDGWCPHCCQNGTTVQVQVPYACKLLFQELQTMNIRPNVILRQGA